MPQSPRGESVRQAIADSSGHLLVRPGRDKLVVTVEGVEGVRQQTILADIADRRAVALARTVPVGEAQFAELTRCDRPLKPALAMPRKPARALPPSHADAIPQSPAIALPNSPTIAVPKSPARAVPRSPARANPLSPTMA